MQNSLHQRNKHNDSILNQGYNRRSRRQVNRSYPSPVCDFLLDISNISFYNLIRIWSCHRVVSESACLHIVRS